LKKALIAVALLVVAAAAAGAGYWSWNQARIAAFGLQPFGSDEAKVVDIPPGSGPKAVAALLYQSAVVSNADDTFAYLKQEKLGPKLKAGEYEFKGALSPKEVIEKVVSGKVKVYRFTVPEGLRVDEILPILAASELKLDLAKLKKLAGTAAFVRKAGVPADTFEGFLYPDTYTFTHGATEEAVLTNMASRTLDEYRKADARRKAGVQLNLLETITLASIIEKETAAVEERPRISCVFHQRLRKKMKLQTDPTVIYAMMLLRGVYSKNITRADLQTEHPYNTYTMKGLPPGPIASAGAAAIQAALDPIDCDDLFFVSRNNGTHVFCPDLKCHEAAVDKWQKEFFRAKHGGG
jgi:UPF0755 protein